MAALLSYLALPPPRARRAAHPRRYAEDHLAAEERLLAEHGWQGLDAHKELHLDYRRRFADLCQQALRRERGVGQRILEFLVEWWAFHVRMEDRRWARDLGFLPATD